MRITEDCSPRALPDSEWLLTYLDDDGAAELSRDHGADPIGVGTGGRSSLGYALLGSVAQHVPREAPSDVLVVPAAGEN
ncbi:universal stress protein [Amycolatopsis coloradensis]|uniref:Universal stress protein n=1 Tax=Amycolatopsis coloradensis TaxID=76021 RepID=A0ACD5BJ87_9PSEU